LNVKQYNDVMIASCWGKIERSINFLNKLHRAATLFHLAILIWRNGGDGGDDDGSDNSGNDDNDGLFLP